ncbi:hypothetical protein TRFO_35469 [Tritrichomonas foetus]|uniref:Ribosome control protein 1 domain-containing protein n=1 Tax=Tritrichomonas foetus TaxID=1144522 RepID=A0A1J4JFZ9_9EUKA|nr:hypothetical protein TRFO_35469 [Tritrichomonas foetus]|eukprot:OHS98142.1 hypothetical protein TRFO_35469 [Tritrichomonas foetus]
MSLLIPFSQQKLDDTPDIIAIASNEYSPHIAFLSRSTISIRDIRSISCPVLESYTRSDESLRQFGHNFWIQWFNSKIIFFGTSSGTIFMLNIDDFTSIKELCISKVILSTFVCHNNLAVTTTSSQIYFINSECQLNYFVTLFQKPMGIRHCSFHQPSTLSCIVDGQPYFISIDKDSFDKKYSPLPKAIPITNSDLVSLSMNKSLLAVSKNDGEIILINVSPKKFPPIVAYRSDEENKKDKTVSMFWGMNENCLVVLKESGRAIIWCYAGFSTHEINLPEEIKSSICMGYESRTHNLYWSDLQSIFFVSFASVFSHFAITSSKVVDLYSNKELMCDTYKVYPIVFFAEKDGHFAAASLTCASFDSKIFIDIDVINLAFVDNWFVIFSIDKQSLKYFMNVFDIINGDKEDEISLKLMQKVEFPFYPLHISVFQETMYVSRENILSLIKFKKTTKQNSIDIKQENNETQNQDVKNESEWSLEIEINSQELGFRIEAAFFAETGKVISYTQSGDVIVLPDGPLIAKNVDYAWSFNSGIPFIFMHTGNTTLVSCFSMTIRIEGGPVFTDGNHAYILKRKQTFGSLEFESRSIGHVFLSYFADNSNYFDVLNNFYLTNLPKQSPKILGNALVRAFSSEKETAFLSRIAKENIRAVAVIYALSKMTIDMKISMFKHRDVSWWLVVPLLKGGLRYSCLISIPFDLYVKVCEFQNPNITFKYKFDNPSEFVNKTIEESDFLRGFILAINIDIDFCNLLQSHFSKQITNNETNEISKKGSDHVKDDENEDKSNGGIKIEVAKLTEYLNIFEKEKKKCGDFESLFLQFAKFFGSSLQVYGMSLFALAVFAVVGDPMKIAGILIVDEQISKIVKEFIQSNPNSPYSGVFEEALKNV